MKTTIKSLVENMKVEYAEAQGLVKFLVTKGVAKDTGEVEKKVGVKTGKGSTIWELPDSALINFVTNEIKAG